VHATVWGLSDYGRCAFGSGFPRFSRRVHQRNDYSVEEGAWRFAAATSLRTAEISAPTRAGLGAEVLLLWEALWLAKLANEEALSLISSDGDPNMRIDVCGLAMLLVASRGRVAHGFRYCRTETDALAAAAANATRRQSSRR